ncbi:MAG: 50S ribosomal protein L3 [Spirochaetales bacterium]|nr:50S ribosomal protein L3 [Spirochaetales bacterium]
MIGLIGKKIGMTQVFDENGKVTPVSVIKFEDNYVVAERVPERDGYSACLLGSVEVKESRVSKPYAGQFKAGVKPQKYLYEIRDFAAEFEVGQKLGVELFSGARYVDVIGTSKGKGYQGVIKRHGFHGGRKTHGSKFHREPGSTGMAASPSKVQKGSRMPGRMGGVTTTVQNLSVVSVDEENQLLLVAGAVPGRRNGTVYVKTAKKKA